MTVSILLISILYGITIGLALSVDAFMLSLIYGSTFKRKRESMTTSLIVGLFHFLMPLIGYFFAHFIFTKINIIHHLEGHLNSIACILLIVLGLLMIFKKNEDEERNIRKLINKCIFAFSVSIDSLLTGVAFTMINEHINIIIVSILFFMVSSTVTFIALSIGKKSAEKLLNTNLDFIAGTLMIILAIITLFI